MADVLEKVGVEAEYVGVGGVGVDGPLLHRLGPVVIAADVHEEDSVKTE